MSQIDKSSRIQREIDRNLKRAYDDVLNEEVPDRFTELLAKLRETGAGSPDSGTEKS